MLVLGRLTNEKFWLFPADGPVAVTLVGMKNGGAKIGVDAPASVEVFRDELLPQVEAERGPGWWERNTRDDLLAACEYALEVVGRQSRFYKADPCLARLVHDLEGVVARAKGVAS